MITYNDNLYGVCYSIYYINLYLYYINLLLCDISNYNWLRGSDPAQRAPNNPSDLSANSMNPMTLRYDELINPMTLTKTGLSKLCNPVS